MLVISLSAAKNFLLLQQSVNVLKSIMGNLKIFQIKCIIIT